MQNMTGREKYIKILWENIPPNKFRNFNTHRNLTDTHAGFPYDYLSIMHYDQYAFSNNGKPTILTCVRVEF